jgi:hypothetical protein
VTPEREARRIVHRYCSTMRVDCLETPSPCVLSSDLISWSSLVSEGSFVTLMASMHTECTCIRGHVVGRCFSLATAFNLRGIFQKAVRMGTYVEVEFQLWPRSSFGRLPKGVFYDIHPSPSISKQLCELLLLSVGRPLSACCPSVSFLYRNLYRYLAMDSAHLRGT